ncbi:winged helix-turn-helix domain-containing protein [Paraburkholderia hospita]|uniref:ATP-binding protein n=1 Tax=Paraburkholderia hospita TaxID=169430 RepID=UPI003ECD2376
METSGTPPNTSESRNAVIPLGQFELNLRARALCKDGHEVPLGSRAFDILTAIVLADGRIVTKDELMETVWPGLFVEESNIHVHLSAVRKALGDHRQLIHTVPGRGYRFMTRERDASCARSTEHRAERTLVAEATDAGSAKHPLPRRRPLFGREEAVEEIDNRFALTRVLTLTGPGGVGKTCLAIELAHRKAVDTSFDVVFIDLSQCGSASAISHALDDKAATHGCEAKCDPLQLSMLSPSVRTLLVLDNAEHLIDDVARTVEGLMAGHDSLHVLVTSRERLRIATETVFRVEPLALPQAGESRDRLVQPPAVRLFLERASLCGARIDDDNELQLVAEICHRLDGLPLAIELAAGRASVFGLEGVRQRLEERFLLLADGYRTAQPRHRTLHAAFDWSFVRLSPCEQAVYLRVARFTRFFTIDAVFAVACDNEIDRASALDCLAQLIEKSLLDVSFNGVMAKYRLSESARAYALKQLERDGESREVARRHAQYVCALLARTSCEDALADARVAFEWAFSPSGEPKIGVDLAAVLVPTLLRRGLTDECAQRAAVVISTLETMTRSACNQKYLDTFWNAQSLALSEPC